MVWKNGEYWLTDERNKMDSGDVERLLRPTYWAADWPGEKIRQAMDHSLCFGMFYQNALVGFARAVTDTATITWICDVVIDPAHRGQGLGKWLFESILTHPSIASTRWILATRDAQGIYKRYGFQPVPGEYFLACGFQWIPQTATDSPTKPKE